MKIQVFEYVEKRPLAWLGLTSDFWTINIDTLIYTWIAMAIIIVLAYVGGHYAKRPYNMVSAAYEVALKFFADLCAESFGFFHYPSFLFVTSIFFFTLVCNLLFLLPFMEEPTHDLNTTLALGLSVFFYVQYRGIRAQGFRGHFKEYFEPFFVLFPLHVVGELAKPVSMSFRLFGNIVGESIILMLVANCIGLFAVPFMAVVAAVLIAERLIPQRWISERPWLAVIMTIGNAITNIFPGLYFFGLFGSVIQAFVISMLAITYLSMAMSHDAPTNNA